MPDNPYYVDCINQKEKLRVTWGNLKAQTEVLMRALQVTYNKITSARDRYCNPNDSAYNPVCCSLMGQLVSELDQGFTLKWFNLSLETDTCMTFIICSENDPDPAALMAIINTWEHINSVYLFINELQQTINTLEGRFAGFTAQCGGSISTSDIPVVEE